MCARMCFSSAFISKGGCRFCAGNCGRPGVLATGADELLDVVVPGRDVGVADRPIDAHALFEVGFEVQIAVAEHVSRPHQRAPARLVAAEPAERLLLHVRVLQVVHEMLFGGLVVQIQRRLHGLRLAVRVGGAVVVRQLPRVLERRGVVGDMANVPPALEHQGLETLFAQLLRGPATRHAGARRRSRRSGGVPVFVAPPSDRPRFLVGGQRQYRPRSRRAPSRRPAPAWRPLR